MQSKPGDPLQALVVKFKEQYGSPNQFIQSVCSVPDLSVVMFNESQLNDMEHFVPVLKEQVFLALMLHSILANFT